MLRRLRQGNGRNEVSPASSTRCSFLHLPTELRNDIYDLIVKDESLTLIPVKGNRAEPPAMLLVSRQIRAEYQPLLLTRAKVVADVYNYDFKGISNRVSSLYSYQLKLLRLNKNLILRLHCLRCRTQDLANLRRWLVQRADSLDRLPWRYDIGWSRAAVALVAKPDMLVGHLDMLAEMKRQMKLDERLDWELIPIEQGLQAELIEVEKRLASMKLRR